MEQRRKNPMANVSPEKIERQQHSLIANCLAQLGTALGQTIPRERIVLYCLALSDIGEAQLKFAFNEALKHLGEYLPSIQQLRSYSEQWRPAQVQDSRRILERGDKPPDWEPLKGDELDAMRREFREKLRKAAAS